MSVIILLSIAIIVVVWRVVKVHHRQKDDIININNNDTNKPSKPNLFNSFYVSEDGTIIRRGNSGNETPSLTNAINNEKEQIEAITLIQESAESGVAEAQYYLGLCYEQGTVVKKNLEMAKMWYRRASAQSFPLAKYRLGKMMMEEKKTN